MTQQHIMFTQLGPTVAWHRAKLSRSNRIDGRGIRVIKQEGDIAFQKALALEAIAVIQYWVTKNKEPWDGGGEWHVEIEFYLQDLNKRDIDNLEKNVLDALSGIVYDDDKQVVSVKKRKMLYRKSPRTIVTVQRVEGYLTEHFLPGDEPGAP